ncbi:uncharacterized protein [Diadema setosum]|uniref:uncharacterized protein n=1 Tax=Diadema setosum TaxID=31175 RepID=UPI003B3BE537
MVNMEETVRVRMTGGPPWGFRLLGGIEHGMPVSVSKIRKRSKADYADLREGDRVLSINGKTVRNAARDVAMAYIDDADDALDLEIVRTSRSTNPRNQDPQTNGQEKQIINRDRRSSNGSVSSNATVRKVTTTTTRIKTTKDGERLQETITKTVTEAIDGEEPKTVSQTTKERGELVGPVRRQSGMYTEHTPPLKVDHGRRTSDVTKTHPSKPKMPGNVTVGQPATITFKPSSKPGVWQPESQQQQQHRQPLQQAQRQQPVYQQPQRAQPQQQTMFQPPRPAYQPPQQHKAKFEMPKPTSNPRYKAPGPSQDFAIFHHKPEPPKAGTRPGQTRTPFVEKQPKFEPVKVQAGGQKPTGKNTAGRELTITFAVPDQHNQVDYGSPPQSPSGMSVDSGVPPESPVTSKKLVPELEEERKPISLLDDPSIILRSLAHDERLQRPFSEPAGRVTEEPEISVVEKRRACKTIADLLMFPKNKQAKGARMFAKRRKRSARYTIEAIGQHDSEDDLDDSSESDSKAAIITIKTAPPPPVIGAGGIPVAPPPPPEGFTQRIRVEPTNFNVKLKSKEKCEHNVVTPKQCLLLAEDLKSQSGKAASMFEKRRLRAEQFVLDESTAKHPKPKAFKKPPGPNAASLEINLQSPATPTKKPTPWEAAAESPVGSVARAFPPKEIKIPPLIQPKSTPPAALAKTNITPKVATKPGFGAGVDRPKGPVPINKDVVSIKAGGHLPKANYKDFNVKARGWGSRASFDNTPGSPASLNSDQGTGTHGQVPSRSHKFGGGYNDFNPKPKAFNADSPRHSTMSPTSSLAESDDL